MGGSLGELEHTIMLEQYSGKARAAEIAPHWRGCAFDLLENKKASRIVLLYSAEWDTEDAAREYFAAYRRQLSQKWKNMAIATETDDAVTGTGDDGRFDIAPQRRHSYQHGRFAPCARLMLCLFSG